MRIGIGVIALGALLPACATSSPAQGPTAGAPEATAGAPLPDKPSTKKGLIVPSDVPVNATAQPLPPPGPNGPPDVGYGPLGGP
jgi:hypothetical protein